MEKARHREKQRFKDGQGRKGKVKGREKGRLRGMREETARERER